MRQTTIHGTDSVGLDSLGNKLKENTALQTILRVDAALDRFGEKLD